MNEEGGEGSSGGGGESKNFQDLYSGNIEKLSHGIQDELSPVPEKKEVAGEVREGGQQTQTQQTKQTTQQTTQAGQQTQQRSEQGGGEVKLPTNFATEMAKAFKDAGMGGGQQQQQQEPAKITDKQFREMTQYYTVTPEAVVTICGKPPRLEGDDVTKEQQSQADNAWILARQQLLQGMTDGAAKHAVVLAGLQTTHMTGQLQGAVSPLLEAQKAQQRDTNLTRLVDSKPALKAMPNGAGKNAINVAIQALASEGYVPQGGSAKERDTHAETAIYKKVEELAKVWNPNFSLDQPVAGGGQQRGGGRAAGMGSSVNGAGGSGSGEGGGQSNEGQSNATRLYATAKGR